MRKEKALTRLLSDLVGVISEEYAKNEKFARRLDDLLAGVPERRTAKTRATRRGKPKISEEVPDVYAEFERRGEAEFRLWINHVPVEVLREIIRFHDFDSLRRTSKWKDSEKLGKFVADQITSRLSRGSAFLRVESP